MTDSEPVAQSPDPSADVDQADPNAPVQDDEIEPSDDVDAETVVLPDDSFDEAAADFNSEGGC